MAKNVKEQVRQPKTPAVEHPLIPAKYQHPAAFAIIYLCLLIFFHSIIFDGKTYQSADSMAAHSWDTLYKDALAEGTTPLWNPYIFCGMPGYGSLTFSIPRTFDLIVLVWGKSLSVFDYLFLGLQSNWILVYYLLYGIGVYLFAFHHLKNKPVALAVSLMATYATYIALLIMIGHITKIAVLAFFPYVFLVVDKLRQKFDFFLAFLLIILVRLMLDPTHVQFIFYFYLALGLYLLFFFIRSMIRKEDWKRIVASGVALGIATIFAFLMGADKYLSTLEYNPYSIRSSNPIVNTSSAPQTKTVEGGLDYEYATSWSFSPGEMMTFFVPSWYGFGPLPYQGPLTQNQQVRLNLYLGPQPFVDGPQYMGIVVIVLACIGLYKNRKDPFVQYMGMMIVLSLLIAFGKELSLVYDLMYRYFPMFNKFRIPLMILILVQFFTPILAGYGIVSLVSERKKIFAPLQEKRWKYLLGGLILSSVTVLVGSGIYKDIYASFFSVQEVGKMLIRSFGQLNPTVLGMLYDVIVSSVITDLLVGFVLLTILFGAFYYYQKGTLNSSLLYTLLIVLVLVDLWRVASKPSEPKDRQENTPILATPDFAKVLQQVTTQFRVLKLVNGQPVYDNSLAYWRLQNAYGYQGAKMRIYQDMVDVAGLGNPLVWQLMNIKYIITDRDDSSGVFVPVYSSPEIKVYGFRSWLPRVFFVNRYEVSDGLSTLKKISAMSFDPRDIAFLSGKMQSTIDPPAQGAEAVIVHYGIHEIEVQATATGNNLLFLSEAYYPKGWKAYIDGRETEIYRLDYLFRGVIIPQGTHTLTMKFEPASFSLGKNISLGTNLLVLSGLLVFAIQFFVRKKKESQT